MYSSCFQCLLDASLVQSTPTARRLVTVTLFLSLFRYRVPQKNLQNNAINFLEGEV
jgi:hypothetical protein